MFFGLYCQIGVGFLEVDEVILFDEVAAGGEGGREAISVSVGMRSAKAVTTLVTLAGWGRRG